ncbi:MULTISPECIES: hypothetical protein [unclassified Actinopolyspora]|uniref:hypothetical protein n=1 Tax=unclassified Actinopolyspora TaxID=2639451 RepID=UPI0013F654C7|nr:hypothetical protein [Actinopolyspora sp. BKK2]NHE77660.1 hypothetical protein [Actinopolyspora sp. BKK1]
MSDYDVRLWRALHRALLVLALGTVLLLIGLGRGAQRADSLFGLLLLGLAVAPAALTVRGMPPHARARLPELPKHRLLLTITAALLACSAVLTALWTLVNLLVPGVLAPLSLAVPVLAGAGLTTLASRLTRTRRR